MNLPSGFEKNVSRRTTKFTEPGVDLQAQPHGFCGSTASDGSSGFGTGFVLVLSIAVLVLVLVLDSFLSHGLFSLDQSSQHRDDPFQIRFASVIPFLVDCIANTQDIVYRSTFECRAPSDFEEAILVAEALFAVALGDVQ